MRKMKLIALLAMVSIMIAGCGSVNVTINMPKSDKTDGTKDNVSYDMTEVEIGTTGFMISIPLDYYEGEVTREDKKDDQIAYYKSDSHLMDFDMYQFGKEGMTLDEYAAEEAGEYNADKVEDANFNGVNMKLYYSQEDYEGKSYRVANYIFENDTDFAELSFWLDGDDAEDIVNQILFSIYYDPGDNDEVMHAF